MGDIILLDPNGINHRLSSILKAEKKNVFRMRITNREAEGRFVNQFVENGGTALITIN